MTLTIEQLEAFAEDNREMWLRRAYEEAAPEAAAAQRVDEELAGLRRGNLTPKQVSDLVAKYGVARYLQIPLEPRAVPRDASGRYRPR